MTEWRQNKPRTKRQKGKDRIKEHKKEINRLKRIIADKDITGVSNLWAKTRIKHLKTALKILEPKYI